MSARGESGTGGESPGRQALHGQSFPPLIPRCAFFLDLCLTCAVWRGRMRAGGER